MRYDAVIFDYEGVLVEMNRERAVSFFQGRSPLPVKMITRRWELWCADHEGDLRDATEMWHAFWEELRLEVEVPPPILDEIRAFDYVGLLEVRSGAVEALRQARRMGLRIGVLSNSALPRLKSSSSPIDLAKLVDVIRVPGRGRPVKPEPEAYLEMARDLSASPDRCLYFDNDSGFVQAARAVGMTGYLVNDRERPAHERAAATELGDALATLTGDNAAGG